MLQNQMLELGTIVDEKLGEGLPQFALSQMGETNRVNTELRELLSTQLTQVAVGVGETKQSTAQVLSAAEQLRDLEKIFRHQKQRANLGEQSLKLILENILPPDAYEVQYRFPSGEAADAAIKTKDGLIPIDAKFPLENYLRLINETDDAQRSILETAFLRDLKMRIDETAKYIRPGDGTLPFAIMFIPAEGIYYDLLVNEVGASKANVRSLLVMPSTTETFTSSRRRHLQPFFTRCFTDSTLSRLRKPRRRLPNVDTLSRHLKAYEDYFLKLGGSLKTAVNHYNEASGEWTKIDKDMRRITGTPAGLEVLPSLSRPQTAD
jgi:DNA recombination protein RmuC